MGEREILGQKLPFLEEKKMLMMIGALEDTIYEKLALGNRIPLKSSIFPFVLFGNKWF